LRKSAVFIVKKGLFYAKIACFLPYFIAWQTDPTGSHQGSVKLKATRDAFTLKGDILL